MEIGQGAQGGASIAALYTCIIMPLQLRDGVKCSSASGWGGRCTSTVHTHNQRACHMSQRELGDDPDVYIPVISFENRWEDYHISLTAVGPLPSRGNGTRTQRKSCNHEGEDG